MNTVTLHKIQLPYTLKLTEEQLIKFKDYDSEASFLSFEDFAVLSYSEDAKKPEEEKEKIQRQNWEKYNSSFPKEVQTSGREVCVDLDLFTKDFPNIEFTYKGRIQVRNSSSNAVTSLLEATARFEGIVNTIQNLNEKTFNQKCNVHIGGSLLFSVNDILLRENHCADELQQDLENGWRILAVCVQPDGRMPDYILGRFNPDKAREKKK